MDTTLFGTKLKSYHKIVLASIGVIICTVIFGFVLYMPFLRIVLKSQKALKPGNEIRDVYMKLPIPLDFRVYFFNVSNPLEVEAGHRPILQEIGPYCYDAYKEKILISENEENDTLTYQPYDTYFFNESRSGDHSLDDRVTILNPLVVGIINAVAAQKPQFLSAINKALPAIFKETNSIYLTARVREILFDGVRIDCNVKDFSATAVCSQFKGQPAFREGEKNIFYFSLFGSRNGTVDQQITVFRGIKSGDTLGRVVAINNQTDFGIWSKPECNEYGGTDGWIFPSFLNGSLVVVAADLCRNFEATYVEDSVFHTIHVHKYSTRFGDNDCYCPTPETCLPKGLLDLTKCLKVPLLCSLPHFLDSDVKLLEQVEGLHPDEDKHIIQVLFEPVTGTPVLGQRRIQLNLELRPLQKISIMRNVSELIHPILWLEEGVELEGYLLNKVITVSSLLKSVTIGRWLVLVFCVLFIGYACYEAYKDWKLSKVSPIGDADVKNDNNKSSKKRTGQALFIHRTTHDVNKNNVNNHESQN